jgi:hypothetical protein
MARRSHDDVHRPWRFRKAPVVASYRPRLIDPNERCCKCGVAFLPQQTRWRNKDGTAFHDDGECHPNTKD